MGAVLTVLSVLLKAMLIILPIILLLVLFFPITWSAEIKKQEGLSVHADLSWLFRFIHAFVFFEKSDQGQKVEKDIRICGISLPALLEKRKKKKKKKGKARRIRTEAPKKPTIRPGEFRAEHTTDRELETEVVKAKHPGFLERLGARISAWIGRIRQRISKLRNTAETIGKLIAYLESESFANCRRVLTKEGKAILRHLLPYKISGTIRFGTDDPAKTGMILGLVSVFYPSLPEDLVIEPDFTESCLETDLSVKGRIVLFVLLMHAIKILMCKDVREMIRRMRNKNKKNKVKKNHKGRGTSCQKIKRTTHFRTT